MIPPGYSLNERHIFSTICHLDMITTLRGLDAILPKHLKHPCKPCLCQTRVERKKSILYDSPYLEPQLRPLVPISKPLPRIPLADPCFSPYDKYKDQSYIVENESSRFYGSNTDTYGCGCSVVNRDMILQQYCPTNRTKKEHEEYSERLYDEFVSATCCYCLCDHKSGNHTSTNEIVHFAQLEQARNNHEFIAILKAYIGQVVVNQIMKVLLFCDTSGITNIKACVNCAECEKDFVKFKKLTDQQNNLQQSTKPYKERILISVFGSKGPAGLLKIFNDIAKERQQTVHACVKDVWKTEYHLWSDYQPEELAVGCCCDYDLETADNINPRDDNLMNCMLTGALQKMREDSKFVIPHLPQANKIPLLKQWIRVRYGIKYSREERAKMLDTSMHQWRLLERKGKFKTPVPMPIDVCKDSRHLHQGDRKKVDRCVSIYEVVK